VVSHPNQLSDTAWRHLKESIREKSEGLGKSHLVMLLEEGMKVEKYGGMPLDDAQFLATRAFQRSEICGIYKVPPHMIGDVDKSTSWGKGIEQQQIGFVTYSLLQWLVRWENEMNDKLLTAKERQQGFFVEFLLDGLLRGDAKTRAEALNIQRRAGIINGNEWRAKENMNPVTGGEIYLISQDMAPLTDVINGTVKKLAGTAPASSGNGQEGVSQ
jgi:HK97 family phage portal protein